MISNMVDMSEYTKALELIEKSRYILIITHVNPDPDSIGSALALSNLFSENKIKHKVFNISSDLPQNLDFIPRFEKITDQLPAFFDLAISVDCGTYKRLGFELDSSIPLINFDHHKSNNSFGTVNIVDPMKSSTAELVFEFFKHNGLYITKNACFQHKIKECNGACIGEESQESYNERVTEFIEENAFENNNMIIIDRGRTFDERSAVLIENGVYKGYCFYELNYQITNIDILKNIIIPMQHNRDIKTIIQSYLRKNKVYKVIKF